MTAGCAFYLLASPGIPVPLTGTTAFAELSSTVPRLQEQLLTAYFMM
jgi:hypothetical protein